MASSIQRISHVAKVLHRHKLGGVLFRFGLAGYLPTLKRITARTKLPPDLPQHVRQAMEELGGAYLKLGQLLSIRPDLVPKEYTKEFSKLLDNVEPEPYTTIIETIEREFGKPAHHFFSHIDPVPLGSASIAQVHKARLKNGTAVVIKVQRPHIKEQFAADIDILRILARRMHGKLGPINPLHIIDEFEIYTRRELDFTQEAQYIDTLKAALSRHKKIRIPGVYWTHTTKRILTMDYLNGTKLSDITRLKTNKDTAKLLIDTIMTQIFELGIFHADLHPGNILLMPNGSLGLLDFGIVGKIDDATRMLGAELYLALINNDPQHIANILLEYGTPSSTTHVDLFASDVKRIVRDWYDSPNDDRRPTHLLHELFELCYVHNIALPRDTVLLGKALITAEATARYLDPQFNFVSYAKPKIVKYLKKKNTPKKLLDRFATRSQQVASALSQLPAHTLDMVDQMRSGDFAISLKDDQFRHVGADINLSSNRLSYSMISAALIIASGFMINSGPKIATYSIISLLCLLGASLFVVALFVSIVREHQSEHDFHIEQAGQKMQKV